MLVPQNLYLYSMTGGVCHIALTFATGFAYSTDVTFNYWPPPPGNASGCTGPWGVAPTQAIFVVDNPPGTCGDAGLDGVGQLEGDAAVEGD
jgi:hypothetical protein